MPLAYLGGSALLLEIFIAQEPNVFSAEAERSPKFLLPRSALTAPMTGKRLYMSLCISLNVMFDFSAHFLPLKGAPLLSVHIGEPSLHSGKNRPKFSAGRTCSHSTLLALFFMDLGSETRGKRNPFVFIKWGVAIKRNAMIEYHLML